MIKFGTGGWRAIIGDDFIKSNIQSVARGIACLNLKSSGKPIIIGYDNRFLSQEASEWVMETFNSYGIDTYTYNISVPTPLVMWETKKAHFDYGVMITASHNPYNYNGIKVFIKGGLDASEEVTKEIEKIANENNSNLTASPQEYGKNYLMPYPYVDYMDEILKMVDSTTIKDAALNINFNGMHGSASDLFEKIMDILDCSYASFAAVADPYFSTSETNTPEPTMENIDQFIKWLKIRESFDVPKAPSFIFDGDGDRLMVLDENKKVVDMNTLLCIYYWYLHEYRHESGGIIKNCATTNRLDAMAEHYNEKCYEVPVGFKYITSNMKFYDALIGGESSGGFAYRGYIYGKDSILASVLLLEILAVTELSMSELVKKIDDTYGKRYYINEKYPIPKKKINLYGIIPDKGAKKDIIDGVKMSYDCGWWLLRPSGTEPIMRIMVEADSPENAEKLAQTCKNRLEMIL